MKFFWVWDGNKIKQLSIIVVAALFAAGLLYVERNELAVFSTPEGPQAFHRANIEENKVSLTFNISWGDERAIPILNILKEKKITATFFVAAPWAERHPEIIERIKEDGHEIGNHGYRYESYPSWEDDKIMTDLRRSNQVLTDLIGAKPTLLRPPNGQFDKRVLKIADTLGYSVIHWSVDSNDWNNPGVNEIVANVVDRVSKGDVILLHASDSVKQTHKALPIILDRLKEKGFQFVSITELLASTDVKSEEIN